MANDLVARLKAWLAARPGDGEAITTGEETPMDDDALVAALAGFIQHEVDRITAVPPRVTSVPSKRIVAGHHNANTGEANSQVIGFQPDRMTVTLRNDDDTNAVYIGGTAQQAASTSGYELAAGESITLETQAAIYVRSATGRIIVHFLIEFGD